MTGGYSNTAGGLFGQSTVSGGCYNTALERGATVVGGSGNYATYMATASGGQSNSALARGATVSGGHGRSATGDYDWRAGSLFEDN